MKRLIYLLLVISLFSFGCAREEDEGAPPKASPAAVNTTPIDPKSLIDTKLETTLFTDEIGGKTPEPGVPIIVKTPSFVVRGWAIDNASKSVAGGVIVNVGGKDFLANYGIPRPDVAGTLKTPNYVNSGFSATIDSAAIGKGKHTLVFRVVTADRKSYFQQSQTFDVIVE